MVPCVSSWWLAEPKTSAQGWKQLLLHKCRHTEKLVKQEKKIYQKLFHARPQLKDRTVAVRDREVLPLLHFPNVFDAGCGRMLLSRSTPDCPVCSQGCSTAPDSLEQRADPSKEVVVAHCALLPLLLYQCLTLHQCARTEPVCTSRSSEIRDMT